MLRTDLQEQECKQTIVSEALCLKLAVLRFSLCSYWSTLWNMSWNLLYSAKEGTPVYLSGRCEASILIPNAARLSGWGVIGLMLCSLSPALDGT